MAVATVQWWTYHMENQALLSKVLLPFDTRIAESHARARAYYEEQRPHFEVAAKRFHLHQHFVDTARNFSETDTTYYDLSEKRLRAMASLLKVTGRDDFLIEKSKRACHSRNKGPRSAVTSGLPPGRRALCGRLGAEPLLPRLPRLPPLAYTRCIGSAADCGASCCGAGVNGCWCSLETCTGMSTSRYLPDPRLSC